MNFQYLTNEKGERTGVFMSMRDFKKIQQDLEELEDIKLYDKSKRQSKGKSKDAAAVFDSLLK
ncbi:MAG: hypothetical protein ACK4NY_24115 [Spirosomataceae bacterium]